MKISEVKNILLAHAVESADDEEEWLSASEKSRATSMAGAPLPKDVGKQRQEQFLHNRSRILLDGLSSKSLVFGKYLGQTAGTHRFGIFVFLILVIAAVIGFLSNELGPEKRINILAFPLIGIVLWNFLVFMRELWLIFRPSEKLFQQGIVHWLSSFFLNAKNEAEAESDDKERVIHRAIQSFENRWHSLMLPLRGIRIKTLLHFTAITLAVAAIAGMYVNGLANEYRAVWESTFFQDSSQLLPFLKLVLGPAEILSGSPLPDADALNGIRWSQGQAADSVGENAARWIHWYAITIGILVVVPRLIFVVIWQVRATKISRSLPYREIAPRYFDHLLSVSTGSSMEIAVTPYAHDPSKVARDHIQRTFEDLYERPVSITWNPMIGFGEEDQAEKNTGKGNSTENVLLFHFAATPEKETHLEVLRHFPKEEGKPLTVLLDAESFDRKNTGFEDSRKRSDERYQSWRTLFADENCDLIVVPDPGDKS